MLIKDVMTFNAEVIDADASAREAAIKMRELDNWLEETVDACREVAQVISGIVVKGA